MLMGNYGGLSTGERFGWMHDLPDFRDHQYAKVSHTKLPPTVRLDEDPSMPAPYDQLQLGSCTANAIAGAVEFDLRRQQLADFMPSRLFIYWNERNMEGSVNSDAGAYIRDGIKSVAKLGVCSETDWQYDIGAFAQRPPDTAYQQALQTRATSYARVPRKSLQRCLADGNPWTIGIAVYSSFEQIGSDGMMPMPTPGEQMLGGHAPLGVGYATINGKLYYRVRNSWGTSWGDHGYLWMPAEYTQNSGLSSDFWAIKTVS